MGAKLLIIVPAHNEEENIVSTIEAIKRTCSDYDYLIVNDGSSDDTGRVCAAHGFRVLNLPVNLGLAGAMRTGMKYALLQGYDYAVQCDADGQHDPSRIPDMLSKAQEGYSIVIGSRFTKVKMKRSMRSLGAGMLRGVIRMRTGNVLTDPTSGMRMFDRSIIEMFARRGYMTPEPDTIMHLILSGKSFAEVPIPTVDRAAGKSYLTFTASVKYMAKTLLSFFIYPKI